MNGPVDTVSIPVPLHDGHLSGLDPGSLPFPTQEKHEKPLPPQPVEPLSSLLMS